ncbi:PREDICTED: protein kintoun [Poecilia mexicana]|uniref:protein kintoun n=1 Tax=Poecilia mexicana TaxID=48701 RepID=UPI00072E1048|nr:PREDICTED: protein kintoun [Poecilia mexicana]
MDIGDKLKELNLSSEEMGRFTKAFKDCKFREMFCEYVQELSEPENRKKYEEEIRQLEQERGNSVDFIQPTPFRVIRTRGAGKQKCFINICANDKIQNPEVKIGVSDDGRRGQYWTLPYSLYPGRTEKDPKGSTFMIYDVIFHPDTLRMASKNKPFMDMVKDTAIDGVQKAYKVKLDKNNVREMKTKYKGTPQTCIIRRPIPGFNAENLSSPLPLLEVPEPRMKSEESPPLTTGGDAQQQIQSQNKQEPEKPKYRIKYRSKIDLQDFRCSRDSVQSPRPKEIVITIDLPLLKSVRDTNLEVMEKTLLLESKQPAYRLHLPLAYPVDEDQGEAKFNKYTGQLTITLPVRPPDESLHQSVGSCPLVSDFQGEDEVEEEQGEEGICEKTKQEVQRDEQKEKNQVENGDEEQKSGGEEDKCQEIKRNHEKEEEKPGTELQNWDLDKQQQRLQVSKEENDEEGGLMTMNENQNQDSEEGSSLDKYYYQKGDDPEVYSQETSAASPATENQDALMSDGQISSSEKDKEAKLTSSLESTAKTTTSELQEAKTAQENMQAEEDASLQQLPPIEEPQISPEVSFPPTEAAQNQSRVITSGEKMESHQVFAADAAEKGRETDEDDLPAHQVLQTLEQKKKPAAVAAAWPLREIGADGKETLITDHSTSAGFNFQNNFIYELD